MAALELNTEAFLRICTPDPVKMMMAMTMRWGWLERCLVGFGNPNNRNS